MIETSFIAGLIALIAGLGIFVLFFLLLILLALYILSSIGLYTMAIRKDIEYPWLAWIPVIKFFVFGEIINEKVLISSLKISYAQVALPVIMIGFGALIAIPYVGWLLGISFAIYNYAAYYRLYKLYRPDSALLFLILSIIFPFMLPIFPFILRNQDSCEYNFS